MKLIDIPSNVPVPWASAAGTGYINPIPPTSQIGINDGYASWPDGFPPLNFEDPSVGGVPPRGADFNGVIKEISAGLRWLQAGGFPAYNSTFSTAIGGYPQGAVLASKVYLGLLWRSLSDDNTHDPDAFGAFWQPYNRLRLEGDLTIVVDTATGNDLNSGLSLGQALKTIGRATDIATSFIDPSGWKLKISIRAGTYTNDPIVLNSGVINGVIYEATHGPVHLNITDASKLAAIWAGSGSQLQLEGDDFVISSLGGASSASGVIAIGGRININGNITYAASTSANLFAASGGFILYAAGGLTDQITADTPRHWWIGGGSQINVNGCGVNFVGTRHFSVAFVDSPNLGDLYVPSFVFTGTATGKRFNVYGNGLISGIGVGTDAQVYFPGDVAGTSATGGQVIA
jgi:hypothetical protein